MTATGDWLSFPDAPRIRSVPPGPNSKRLLERQAQIESEAVVYPKHFPIAIARAQGATLEDVDGNRFLDWVAGVSVLNLGHRHPRLEAAMQRQAERVWHTLELPTEVRIEFLERLSGVLPGKLRHHARTLLTVTGGDAVETAVNIAAHLTGKRGVLAFSGAYHGVHGGAATLTSGRKYQVTSAFSGGPVVRVPYPDPYRPILGADTGAAGTIAFIEHLLNDPYSGVPEVGAILVEPVLGEGGYVVPPDDFLPGLREVCDRHGLLLIADEIQSGLGRTGTMWAVEASGVTPDLICIAKTIGGGLPVSMVSYRDDLGKPLPPAFHLGTYRGNALALAVGIEVLKVLVEEEWPHRTARRGAKVLERFREHAERFPVIGEARGRGFMIGVELVQDRAHRTPWGEGASRMRRALFERGVLMHTCGPHDQVLRFMSPLIIEDELLERGLAVFEESLQSLSGGTASAGPLARARSARGAPNPPVVSHLQPPGHAPIPLAPPPGRELPDPSRS